MTNPDLSGGPDGSLADRRDYIRHLALEQGKLLQAIIRFNTDIHREENGNAGKEPRLPVHFINGSNRAKALLVGRLSTGFWDFQEESRRLALLHTDTLKDLITSWGTAFCAPVLNQFVLKRDLDILDQTIGRKKLDFARGFGRFCIGEITEIMQLNRSETGADKMAAVIAKTGMQAYGICSFPWPRALKEIEGRRMKIHLPDLFDHRPKLTDVAPAHIRSIWFSMKKILLKEVSPQWTPYFS